MTIEAISKQIEGIEASLSSFQEQAKKDIENTGKVSTETKNALDKMGEKQIEIAARLLSLEQKGIGTPGDGKPSESMGAQFTNSASYKSFQTGQSQRAGFEVQNNTLGKPDYPVDPQLKPGIVGGPEQPLTLESMFTRLPCISNAVDYVREVSFTNNAAEVLEKGAKPESALTFEKKQMHVSTVAHWIKITKQLADDAPLLAAYINARMIYGVNRKVETQLAVGDGVDPNISGLFDTGNFTPHGIANAALGTTLKAYVLFRKVMAALEIQGYTPSAILLNPLDVANLDVEIMTSQTLQGASIVNAIRSLIRTSVGVAQDTFLIGDFGQAATLWDREAVNIAMSREDGTNFTTNLITILAERRLALTVEVPAAIIGGDLTPA